MKKQIVNLTILIIAILFISSCKYQSNKDNNNLSNYKNKSDSCLSLEKVSLLLDNILAKKYLFPVIGVDTNYTNQNRYNFLINEGFILPNKNHYIKMKPTISFTSLDSIKLLPVIKDTLKNKEVSRVYLTISKMDFDTSNVDVKVGYIVHGKVPLTEASFKYQFDLKSCEWIMLDSTFRFY